MPTFTRKLSDLIAEDFEFGLTDLDYPIFDETYRTQLNNKILRHYWNYEIGQETESMFRFALNRKMNEIMPLYNQLYNSAKLEIDPLLSMNYTDIVAATGHLSSNTSADGTNSATSHQGSTASNSSDTTGKARSVNSTTPQVMLSGNEDYASSANDTISDTKVNADTTGSVDTTNSGTNHDTGTRTDDTNSSADRTVRGYNIPTADLLLKFRATFLNIDMMVIDELQTLFMQVWDNGDEYFGSEGMMYGVSPFGW